MNVFWIVALGPLFASFWPKGAKKILLENWRITRYFVALSVIILLRKTDFIYRTSFAPGLQQADWQKAAD